MWKLYIIHFDRPYKHARHYIGIALNVTQRIKRHMSGNGSVLMKQISLMGISFKVVLLGEFSSYTLAHKEEKKLKARGGGSRSCPICKKGK